MKNKLLCILVGMLLCVTAISVTGEMNKEGLLSQKDRNPSPIFEGQTYFILLSAYEDLMGQDNEWAVQLRFDSMLGVVEFEYFGEDAQLPLVTDQWVEIRCEIDLDQDPLL